MTINGKRHVVFEGVDFAGKGTAIEAILSNEGRKGTKVFDVDFYQRNHGGNLRPEDVPRDTQVVFYSEPTYAHTGRLIRDELIKRKSIGYSAEAIAEAFALDRRILFETLLGPLLEERPDITLLGSRSLVSSLVYQAQHLQQASGLSLFAAMRLVRDIPGNNYVWSNFLPGLVGITVVEDAKELMKRKAGRRKNDDAIFEEIETLVKLSGLYKHHFLQRMLRGRGVSIRYIDAGNSVEDTEEKAISVWDEYLNSLE